MHNSYFAYDGLAARQVRGCVCVAAALAGDVASEKAPRPSGASPLNCSPQGQSRSPFVGPTLCFGHTVPSTVASGHLKVCFQADLHRIPDGWVAERSTSCALS